MNNQRLLTDEEIQEAAQSAAIPEVSGIFLHDLLEEARAVAQAQLKKVVKGLRERGQIRLIFYGAKAQTGELLKVISIELYLEDWQALLQEVKE